MIILTIKEKFNKITFKNEVYFIEYQTGRKYSKEEAEQLKQGRQHFVAVKNKSKEFIIVII